VVHVLVYKCWINQNFKKQKKDWLMQAWRAWGFRMVCSHHLIVPHMNVATNDLSSYDALFQGLETFSPVIYSADIYPVNFPPSSCLSSMTHPSSCPPLCFICQNTNKSNGNVHALLNSSLSWSSCPSDPFLADIILIQEPQWGSIVTAHNEGERQGSD